MVQVRLEVRKGATRFRVSVRARSAQRAASLAGARFPGSEVRLLSPPRRDFGVTLVVAGKAAA